MISCCRPNWTILEAHWCRHSSSTNLLPNCCSALTPVVPPVCMKEMTSPSSGQEVTDNSVTQWRAMIESDQLWVPLWTLYRQCCCVHLLHALPCIYVCMVNYGLSIHHVHVSGPEAKTKMWASLHTQKGSPVAYSPCNILYVAWYMLHVVRWLRNHRNLSIARWSNICDIDFWGKWHCFGKRFSDKSFVRCTLTVLYSIYNTVSRSIASISGLRSDISTIDLPTVCISYATLESGIN